MVKMKRGNLIADVHDSMVEEYKNAGYELYEEPKKVEKTEKVEKVEKPVEAEEKTPSRQKRQ